MNNPLDFQFFCYPTKPDAENPDGSPACIEECPLAEAEWISVYRRGPEPDDVEWQFDLTVTPFDAPEQLAIAQGLCSLLNAVTTQEALYNPTLHIFFM